MGTVRARQKSKKSARKVTRRVKDKKKEVHMTSNPIIEANWDYNLTLKQNYKKLGLTVRLGQEAGGSEANVDKPKFKKGVKSLAEEPVIEEEDLKAEDIPVGEARIIRDDNGEVVEVIYGTKKKLDEDYELVETEEKPKTKVIEELENYAKLIKKDRPRTISIREDDWIKSLVDKYGDDYGKMKWDKKLNIYQQSEGQLKKKILNWKKKNST